MKAQRHLLTPRQIQPRILSSFCKQFIKIVCSFSTKAAINANFFQGFYFEVVRQKSWNVKKTDCSFLSINRGISGYAEMLQYSLGPAPNLSYTSRPVSLSEETGQRPCCYPNQSITPIFHLMNHERVLSRGHWGGGGPVKERVRQGGRVDLFLRMRGESRVHGTRLVLTPKLVLVPVLSLLFWAGRLKRNPSPRWTELLKRKTASWKERRGLSDEGIAPTLKKIFTENAHIHTVTLAVSSRGSR